MIIKGIDWLEGRLNVAGDVQPRTFDLEAYFYTRIRTRSIVYEFDEEMERKKSVLADLPELLLPHGSAL